MKLLTVFILLSIMTSCSTSSVNKKCLKLTQEEYSNLKICLSQYKSMYPNKYEKEAKDYCIEEIRKK